MPTFNSYWAKYGCTKCNNYKLLVLSVDPTDSKSSFVSSYVNAHGVKCPAVAKGEGAEQLCSAIGHDISSSGPRYLIKPDKSVKGYPGASEIDNAGGNVQHVCGTSHVCSETHRAGERAIAVRSLSAGRLGITVPKTGDYRISAHTADGRCIANARTRLEAGDNSFNFGIFSGSARVTVISIKGEYGAVTHKVVWHD